MQWSSPCCLWDRELPLVKWWSKQFWQIDWTSRIDMGMVIFTFTITIKFVNSMGVAVVKCTWNNQLQTSLQIYILYVKPETWNFSRLRICMKELCKKQHSMSFLELIQTSYSLAVAIWSYRNPIMLSNEPRMVEGFWARYSLILFERMSFWYLFTDPRLTTHFSKFKCPIKISGWIRAHLP